MKRTIAALALAFLCSLSVSAQNVWINEFHYDNDSADVGEFVEVVAPSSFTDLANVTLTLYNGSVASLASYDSRTLSQFAVGAIVGNFTLYSFTFPANGIQNGAPDALALSSSGSLLQFLSYEGTFTAVDGPANGIPSTSIGLFEVNDGVTAKSTPIGSSLGLSGDGLTYADFTWSEFVSTATPGSLNVGQQFIAPVPEPSVFLLAGLAALALVLRRRRS